jgi:hypothetical protein
MFIHFFTCVTLGWLCSFAVAAPPWSPNAERDIDSSQSAAASSWSAIKRDLDFTKPETWTDLIKLNTRAMADTVAPEKLTVRSENSPEKRSAGLYWGPVYIDNLKLYITNQHTGYAGPCCQDCSHINVHVDKETSPGKYKAVVNAHVVHSHKNGQECLCVWDSVTKKTLFDSCLDDFLSAAGEAVSAIKSVVDTALANANFLAKLAIIAALIIALGAAIAALPAVALA